MRGRGTADRVQHVAVAPGTGRSLTGGRHRAAPAPRAVIGAAVARRTVLLATAGVVVLAVARAGWSGSAGRARRG